MDKTAKIAEWLQNGKNKSYGSLHLIGADVHTYNVLLARVNRADRRAVVNGASYSTTSSGHRNRVLEALRGEGYEVVEVAGPEAIPEKV